MKRRLAFLAVMMLAVPGTAVLAQGGPPAGAGQGGAGQGMDRAQMMRQRMERLLTGITLSAEQRARIDSIGTAFAARTPQMQMGGERPSQETMEQMRTLNTQRDSTLRAVLTPEQQAVWDQNVASMPRGRRP